MAVRLPYWAVVTGANPMTSDQVVFVMLGILGLILQAIMLGLML